MNKTLKHEKITKNTKNCIQFYRNSVIFKVKKMSQKNYTNNNGISCKKANKHSPQLNKWQLRVVVRENRANVENVDGTGSTE